MHITPKLNSGFQLSIGCAKKTRKLGIEIRKRKADNGWMQRNYLDGVPITRTIPGLRLARFPLFSFKSSTVTL